MKNTNRQITIISWILCVFFLVGVFVPGFFGMDGMNGGFALSAFLLFMAIVFGSACFVYGKLAREQMRIFADENLLAHWEIAEGEWKDYVSKEYERDTQEKKTLFMMVAGWAVAFAILFPFLDHENGYWVTIVMVGLIVLIGIVARLSVFITHRSNVKSAGLVRISTYGVYFGGRMYSWGMVGGMLEAVSLEKEYLEVAFMGGKTSYTIRIPVPVSQRKKAMEVEKKLKEIAVASKSGILQKI